jgi:flagellar operon protein (TIGR03826 family)
MPEVRNCRRCGKVYTYLGGAPLCYDCKKEDEEDFKRTKEYLYKNPGANLTQVSEELGISVEKIRRFLKEGRLEIVDEQGNMFLECENCGKSIRSGRFCDECERLIAQNMKTVADQLKSRISPLQSAAIKKDINVQKKNVEMRYLNREK